MCFHFYCDDQSYDLLANLFKKIAILDAARSAVQTLGTERQGILRDVRCYDVSNSASVGRLWDRLDSYLYDDNVRPHLETAILKLGVCREEIEEKADGAWWRRRNKTEAVQAFSETLGELQSTIQSLTSNFYPGGSGMRIQTLMPIYELIKRVKEDSQPAPLPEDTAESIHEELGELAKKAIRDASHEEWFRTTAEVEALITELELAFSVKVTEETTSKS